VFETRRYTVHDVLSIIESGEFDRADVFITPPSGEITDEDSADEDSGGLVDNLSRRQLQADCEAVVSTVGQHEKMHIGCASDTDSDEGEREPEQVNPAEVSTDIEPVSGKRCIEEVDQMQPDRKRQKSRSVKRTAKKAPAPVASTTKQVTEKRSAQKTPHATTCNEQQTSRPTVEKKKDRRWKKCDLPERCKAVFQSKVQEKNVADDFSPPLFFEQFFDDAILKHMVEQSIVYAKDKGDHRFTVNSEEIRAFLAILILSGYVPLSRRRMFWEQSPDVHNEDVTSLMARDRFEEIMRYLHFADNSTLDASDKFAKLRPLFVHMNTAFVAAFCREQNLSIDESMVPYYGRHGCKQFIRGKPIRFGYKVWSLNTPLGYMIQFEPYQGKGGVTHAELGLGGSVVMDLLKCLPAGPSYNVYFDNFFTSLRLIDRLTELQIGATGTVRANRIENCPVDAQEIVKKKPRGSYDYRYDDSGKFVVIRWNDNSVVTLASNVHGVLPVEKVKRWSSSEKKRIEVSQPAAIKFYNTYMGGTDRMDQNVSCYRTCIRSKKWWWALFVYFLDVALQNGYYLYKRSPAHQCRPLDFLGFRRDIVDVYRKKYAQRLQIGRPVGRVSSLDKRLQSCVRYDGKDHLIDYSSTQRVCMECHKKANFICVKCDVGLHPKDCFMQFHQL
jgi:YD repeat-containing protein